MKNETVEEPALGIDTVHAQLGILEGKILTIVDASYSDIEQRKAVKDLTKKMFREQRNHLDNIIYGFGTENIRADEEADI